MHRSFIQLIQSANRPFQVSGPAQGEVPPFVPQPSSTRQVSSTGLSRRCCLRASPDRPTRLRLAVPKRTRRQGEETPLGPSSGEETPISQDGMSYRVRSLPSSLFHPSNRALPSDCVARVEKLCLMHDSFGWPDAVVQLLFGSRF